MLKAWLTQQRHGYWLATAQLFRDALTANKNLPFPDTKVLFQGKRFDSVMSMTPVLIPAGEEVIALPDEILNQGIGIATQTSDKALLLHLQSLLFAGLDGEEVLFRFYDKEVLGPMLYAFEKNELSMFLGNCTAIAIEQDTKMSLAIFSRDEATLYEYQPTPWWKIKPSHLNGRENKSLIQSNLISWLWQYYQGTMDQHLENKTAVADIINSCLNSEGSLTRRILTAAIALIQGKESLNSKPATDFLEQHKDEDVLYALYNIKTLLNNEKE